MVYRFVVVVVMVSRLVVWRLWISLLCVVLYSVSLVFSIGWMNSI